MPRGPDEGSEGEALRHAAEACTLIRCFAHLAKVASTQDEARRLAAAAGGSRDAHGLLVLADEQSCGRGRLGRAWHSPRGAGLWLSLVLAPRRPTEEWPFVTALAALAVRSALIEAAAITGGIKWPNDLLVRGRKICGILAESAPRGPLVLGVGLNLSQRGEDFPVELRETATSVALEAVAAGRQMPARATLLTGWLEAFARRFAAFEETGPRAHLEDLRAASLLMGRTIELAARQADSAALRGRVVDLGARGELILAVGSHAAGAGERVAIHGGEILSVEPPLSSESPRGLEVAPPRGTGGEVAGEEGS